MPVSYQSVFGLNPDFSQEDLEQAYEHKVNNIKNTVKDEIDRHLLLDQLDRMYTQARRDLYYEQRWDNDLFGFNRFFQTIHRDFQRLRQPFEYNRNEIFSSSTVYNERTLPDGSRLVVQKSSKNDNGNVTETTNSYKKWNDGKTEPVDYSEAVKHLNNNGDRRSIM